MRTFPVFAFVLSIAVSAPARALGEPAIHSVEGSVEHGGSVSIKGDGFGRKEPAAPILWADFEKGLEPSSKGRNKSWSQIQNMVWKKNGPGGVGCAMAEDGSGTWTLRVDHKHWTEEGSLVYVYRRQRMNFMITDDSQNWKVWRMWPEKKRFPNIYIASNNGRVFVEKIGTESGFWGKCPSMPPDWVREEVMLRPSTMNVKNGYCALRYNGVEVLKGTVITRSLKAPDYMVRNYVVHAVGANFKKWRPAWNPQNRIWVDEVYADNSWARVILSDRPQLDGKGDFRLQIPERWSPTEVTVHVHAPGFKPGTTAYLFVFDHNGTGNSTGFPVTISGPVAVASGVRNPARMEERHD